MATGEADDTRPPARPSRPWTLPAGGALDAAVFWVLMDMREPRVLRERRVRPWSRHAGLTCALISFMTCPFGPEDGQVSVVCTSHAGGWSCSIEAPTWYGDADGSTLPEAFCRALVQEEGMDTMEDEVGPC